MVAIALSTMENPVPASRQMNLIVARLCTHPTQFLNGSADEKYVGSRRSIESTVSPLIEKALRMTKGQRKPLFIDVRKEVERFEAFVSFIQDDGKVGQVLATIKRGIYFLDEHETQRVFLSPIMAERAQDLESYADVLEVSRYLAFDMELED